MKNENIREKHGNQTWKSLPQLGVFRLQPSEERAPPATPFPDPPFLSSVCVFLSKPSSAAATRPIWSPREQPTISPLQPLESSHLRGLLKNSRKIPLLGWGSTNMPLFDRVHECKEYEYWNEKKVWIVSVTKWTLSKNKRDPQKDTSKIRTHSSQ